MNTKPEQDWKVIDNPGAGDCGPYAFALGLFILHQNHPQQDIKATWQALDPDAHDVVESMFSCSSVDDFCQKGDDWSLLQASLRRIFVQGIKDSLAENMHSQMYFNHLKYKHKENLDINYFNTKEFVAFLQTHPNIEYHDPELQIQLKQAVAQKVLAADTRHFDFWSLLFLQESPKPAPKPVFWFDDVMLSQLATSFEIELKFFNSSLDECPSSFDDGPFIALENLGKKHWKTRQYRPDFSWEQFRQEQIQYYHGLIETLPDKPTFNQIQNKIDYLKKLKRYSLDGRKNAEYEERIKLLDIEQGKHLSQHGNYYQKRKALRQLIEKDPVNTAEYLRQLNGLSFYDNHYTRGPIVQKREAPVNNPNHFGFFMLKLGISAFIGFQLSDQILDICFKNNHDTLHFVYAVLVGTLAAYIVIQLFINLLNINFKLEHPNTAPKNVLSR